VWLQAQLLSRPDRHIKMLIRSQQKTYVRCPLPVRHTLSLRAQSTRDYLPRPIPRTDNFILQILPNSDLPPATGCDPTPGGHPGEARE
jgi:hypothetical protein